MEEQTRNSLTQILLALRALSKSTERSLHTGSFQGTGDMAVRSYRALQAKIAELLPDDFYVSEVLKLEVTQDSDDRAKLNQVVLSVVQMVEYLEGLLRSVSVSGATVSFNGELNDLRTIGRDLQEQILNITKTTLRRALSNIEVGATPPTPPVPPVPPTPPSSPRGYRVEIRTDDDDEQTPPGGTA